MQLSVDQIDYLNIGLMIVSCLAAFVFPFELFLFSYAVLRPLHYLTEISWLHEKNYFTESGNKKRAPQPNRRWLILVALTMCALILGFVAAEILHTPLSPKWEITMFKLGSGTSAEEVYESTVGLMIMRLIAFAYTYHYLNWFSKTSIIKWHEIPKSRTVIIGVVWLASLALYAYNYDTGMAILYFLSILHVMLEFPLNHRTFAGIGREFYAIAK